MVPNPFNGKGIAFSISGAVTTGFPYAKKMKLDPYLIPHRKSTQNGSMT